MSITNKHEEREGRLLVHVASHPKRQPDHLEKNFLLNKINIFSWSKS